MNRNANPDFDPDDTSEGYGYNTEEPAESVEPTETVESPEATPGRRPTSHAREEHTAGFPLRGIAMVLIAAAVGLGLWGLYYLTQSGDDADSQNASVASDSAATGGPEGVDQQGKDGKDAARDDAQPNANKDAKKDKNAADSTAKPNEDAKPGQDAEAGAGAEAGSGAGTATAPTRVSVLNNSTVANLAKDVSGDIKNKGYKLGDVGNFADEILPETTVFFPAGDKAAEDEARQLASDLGGIARENIDSLPKEATKDRALTVVLVDPNA